MAISPTASATVFAVSCAGLLLTACGGGGGGSTPTQTNGTLVVSMTDAPSCGFKEINVTVSKIRVHQSATASDSDAGWTDIPLNPESTGKFNLLDLNNGLFKEMGKTPLTPGRYTQLRLLLEPNTGNSLKNSAVLADSNSEVPLATPSGQQSGIKLTNAFDVAAGERVELMLDFDACKSIVTRGKGNYQLKPVIKVIPTVVNGVEGYVDLNLVRNNHVQVSAQQNGRILSSTAPDTVTGKFYLSRLTPGNYDVVISADRSASAVIGAVPVESTTSTTVVSTSAAPISLAASQSAQIRGTVKFNLASTEGAYVAARQTLQASRPVTIRYSLPDLLTGEYALTELPTAPPRYAPYSATSPLTFTPAVVSPGAGQYEVEATVSEIKATTIEDRQQTRPAIDVNAGNQLNVDFTFTP